MNNTLLDPASERKAPSAARVPAELLALKQENISRFKRLIGELQRGAVSPVVDNLPLELYLDLTRRCNLKCIMCSHEVESLAFIKKHGSAKLDFPADKFRVFEGMLASAAMVYTVGLGEALLHKGFADFVRLCRSYGAFVWANSNAMALTEKTAGELVDASLSRLVLSVSGGTKESYEHYHRGADWNKLWKNIEGLHSARLARGQRYPQLFMNFVVMDDNLKELPGLLAQTLPFDLSGISVKPLVNMHKVLDTRKGAPVVRRHGPGDAAALEAIGDFAGVFGLELDDASYLENHRSVQKRSGICLHPFSTLMVSSSGDVYPCGQGESVGGPELVLGNIADRTLEQIWTGPELAKLRQNFIKGNYGPGCRECMDKQLCRLHNDTNDTTAGFTGAAELGCAAPGPKPACCAGTGPADTGLWPAPPPQEALREIKKKNFQRYALSIMQRRETALNTPLEIFLESANACNLRCKFCATQANESRPSGPATIMSDPIMKSVQAFLPGAAAISLHGFGEPLLNRSLVPAAVRAKEYLLNVDFFTNGMLLNKERARALAEGGVPGFTVSISTADAGRYETLYEGGKLALLAENLKFLKEEKARLGKTTPRVQFNAIAMRETLPDLPGLVRLAAELGVAEVVLKPLVTYPNLAETLVQKISFDALRDGPALAEAHAAAKSLGVSLSTAHYEATGAAKAEAPQHAAGAPAEERGLKAPCPLVYRTMYVRSNGQVKPCCFSSDELSLSLGDVTRQTAHEIWNGERYKELRKAHNELRVPPLCAHCVKFNLAPPSDSSAHWLAGNGVTVSDPRPLAALTAEALAAAAGLERSVGAWKAGRDDGAEAGDAVLLAFVALLKAANMLLSGLEGAGGGFPGLESVAGGLVSGVRSLMKAADACGKCADFRSINLSVEAVVMPQLGNLTELLEACRGCLGQGPKKAGNTAGNKPAAAGMKNI